MIDGLGLSLSGMKLIGNKKNQLKQACSEVESLFLYMMLKEMQKTVDKNPIFGQSNAEEIYQDMKNIELSRVLSEKSVLGLADLLFKSMKKFL